MRVWVITAALAGCNSIYGLDETRIRDGAPSQFFDAPTDAPFGCPADGNEPLFKIGLRQVPVSSCYSYVPSYDTSKALAQCGSLTLAQGDIDASMQSIDLGNATLSEPRLFPEGDRAFARDPNTTSLHLLVRGETWSDSGQIMTTGPADWTISNPTRGPDRRAIVFEYNNGLNAYQIVELVESGGTWTQRDVYPAPRGYHPSITSDGLRMVFDTGFAGLYYSARADRNARFTTFTKLSTAPGQSLTPFLTDDCATLYFSALDTVFSLQQR